MTIQADIHTLLESFVGHDRVYPLRLDQNCDKPAVKYQLITGPRISAMGADVDLVRSRYQIDCFAETYSKMVAERQKIVTGFQRYSGTHTKEIVVCFIEPEQDDFEQETQLYRGIVDIEINYRE